MFGVACEILVWEILKILAWEFLSEKFWSLSFCRQFLDAEPLKEVAE